MDADRFDLLARSLVTSSRRGMSRALAGLGIVGGLSPLLAMTDAEARKKRKKKKKKKCKGGKKKCGKKCVPKSACCPACSAGQTCQNGVCQAQCDVCPSGCTYSRVIDAIAEASADDTITICAGAYVGNLVIDKSLTLIGSGNDAILQGTGTDWVVTIDTLEPVTLQDLRITGGVGGIGNFGTLELIGCTVSDNETDSSGGGIYNEGTLDLIDSTISDNSALAGGGGIMNAGLGVVTLTNSSVVGNNSGSDGGGIYNFGDTVTLDLPSRITDNRAAESGGGIFNNGGEVNLASEQNVTGNDPDNCRPEDSVLMCVG